MAYVLNEQGDFADEARRGLLLAHPDLLRDVPGGVASTRVRDGKVALVVGGGSGHYPAFAGLVGPGLADGAVMGNVFAAPSARQVLSVARAVERGAGVLLSYGNYTGDVMSFDAAEAQLRELGVPVRTVRVTDDVASAPPGSEQERRGIAGDLIVFKLAGAAATRGADLDEVARVAEAANAVTRTLGVAFQGATLPGATEPLFTLEPGRMALGVGIHGEPGLSESDLVSSRELASLLWSRVRAELPARPDERLVLLVNGLGSVKNEELFVFYQDLYGLATGEGARIADVRIGEFVTSFEMAGISLTVASLTDEQLELWRAPAYTPAFVMLDVDAGASFRDWGTAAGEDRSGDDPDAGDGDAGSAPAAILACFEAIERVLTERQDDLGRLDAVAGDGDHGIGMVRGARAAARSVRDARGSARAVLTRAGDAWEDAAGGTSGALWGALIRAAAERVPDASGPADAGDWLGGMVDAAHAAVAAFGAQPGDRTMLDALDPYRDDILQTADRAPAERLASAAAVATQAAEATARLVPRRGRAKAHAGRAIDSPDPGAVSFALVVSAIADVVRDLRET